jgi:hypothetical protein
MPYHRFKVGQIVETLFGGADALIPRGPHVTLRLLPLQYRIRSNADGLERAVLEAQIRRMEEPPLWRIDKPDPTKPARRRR